MKIVERRGKGIWKRRKIIIQEDRTQAQEWEWRQWGNQLNCGCLLHCLDLVSDYISQLYFQFLAGRVFCTLLCILFIFEAHLHSHCSFCLAVLILPCNIIIFYLHIPPALILPSFPDAWGRGHGLWSCIFQQWVLNNFFFIYHLITEDHKYICVQLYIVAQNLFMPSFCRVYVWQFLWKHYLIKLGRL